MSHVDFTTCPMSCQYIIMLISPMSHVDFKKMSCRNVDFRGQEPCELEVGA